MKRLLILTLTLAISVPVFCGCAIFGSTDGPVNPIQQQHDIHFFVKMATRIALSETNPTQSDLVVIMSYLEAARDLVNETGPSLSGLRSLAESLLPEKHKVLGLTILDVIERYLLSVVPDPTEDQAKALKLVAAGLDGAIEAIQEHQTM